MAGSEKIKSTVRQEWLACRAAIQFLTCLPVGSLMFDRALIGRALLWFPVAGLLLGLILQVAAALLSGVGNGLLQAALVLALWVLLTGALHLDGLADVVDAWAGGLGDRRRTLAIMKDPRVGPLAVVALVLLLLLKLVALTVLVSDAGAQFIWAVPVLGRTLVVSAFMSTPYVREQGLGEVFVGQSPQVLGGVTAGVAVFLLLIVPAGLWLTWMILSGTLLLLWRLLMLKRLGGFTGDCAGALIEVTEMFLLLAVAMQAVK